MRDTSQGDIGLIVGPLVEVPILRRSWVEEPIDDATEYLRTQRVLWPSNNGEPYEMDIVAIEEGLVEVLSESR